MIQTYRGYGSRDEVFLMGRVFRQPGLGLKLGEGPLDDLVNIARRTARWGIRDARLAVTVGDARASITTDRDGYCSVQLPIKEPLPDGAFWQQARLELLPASEEADPPTERGVAATAEMYIPPREVDLAVVSDIDDTVIYTGVASKLTHDVPAVYRQGPPPHGVSRRVRVLPGAVPRRKRRAPPPHAVRVAGPLEHL